MAKKNITKEELAKQIFEEYVGTDEEVTMAEAMEMAEMEIGAKEIPTYVETEKTKVKKKEPRERKVDNEKLEILQLVKTALTEAGYMAEIEKEVALHFGDGEYTLKLIRHRPKK